MAKPEVGTILGGLGVAAVGGALTIAGAASNAAMWPDAVEYVAIGNAWVNGAGFVDPVKWTNYLDTGVPFLASILRAPLPAILLAIPLLAGKGVVAVKAFHALLASLVLAGLTLFARRLMSTGAAVACALFVGLFPAWLAIAPMPMSDLLAIGAMLLVFATSVRVADSVPMASVCAASTLVAWATRPTLAALAGPLALVVLRQVGVRGAWSRRGLPVYLAATAVGLVALQRLSIAVSGYSTYAGYGFMAEMLSLYDPLSFTKRYVGTVDFVRTRWPLIEALIQQRASQVVTSLFGRAMFSTVGWIAVPGVLYCLVVGGAERPRVFLRQLVALSGILFTAVTIATYASYDAWRYPLPTAVCGALCGFALIDDLIAAGVARIARRSDAAAGTRRQLVRVAAALPTVIVLMLHPELPVIAGIAARQWATILTRGPYRHPTREAADAVALCRDVRPGVVVATPKPWEFHAWCGNPTITVPFDLQRHPRLQEKFFLEAKPGYVVADVRFGPMRWLSTSPLVRAVGKSGNQVVFEVSDLAPRQIAWRQPPPLMCAGFGDDCRRALNR